jgi:thioredoxin-related protein
MSIIFIATLFIIIIFLIMLFISIHQIEKEHKELIDYFDNNELW